MALSPLPGTATTTVKVGDHNAMITALNAELVAIVARLDQLEAQADLTERVGSLEMTVANLPPPVAVPTTPVLSPGEAPPRPTNLDPNQIEMVYDTVVLYYHDLELHAQRIGDRRWRLVSALNFIVVSPIVWTYDEIVEGTADEVYAHAIRRLEELARLKPIHDAVHARVRSMSEGQA